jgi:hypothetical protein
MMLARSLLLIEVMEVSHSLGQLRKSMGRQIIRLLRRLGARPLRGPSVIIQNLIAHPHNFRRLDDHYT